MSPIMPGCAGFGAASAVNPIGNFEGMFEG
jgi:hypothetical protein